MRRKSERSAAIKKSKSSPEKKVDKTKRTRAKRRKQSISSDNESADETISTQEIESVDSNSEPKESQICVKGSEVEETHEQVWQVKTAEGSGDVGEIQKLKICLTRPPSTPEMVECSPHSKRKHSRTTSSSDTPSTEGGDEKKKKKHSKRSSHESKDETERSHESHDDSEIDTKKLENCTSESMQKKLETCASESTQVQQKSNVENLSGSEEPIPDTQENLVTDQDTSQNQILNPETNTELNHDNTSVIPQSSNICNDSEIDKISENQSGSQEVLDNGDTIIQTESEDQQNNENPESNITDKVIEATSEEEVSNIDNKENRAFDEANSENKASDDNVLDTSQSEKTDSRETCADSEKDKEIHQDDEKHLQNIEQSDSTQTTKEECVQHDAVLVINRKRRWGSRPNKITTQKSITISTDVLKEIIPDVKPVEFDEIIEEKKQHKRVEVREKIDRPILPKIVIDNTEHIDHKKDPEDIQEKETSKGKESHLGVNRKISIVKDNGSIITRPPSPPRNKQSCILFITNLVRPFTLPQLKNLLQRTGRIIEGGFWIDKIKSKCFVKYETEDQAVETRHALHGVTWPISNPKTLHVDFSTQEAFAKAKLTEEQDNAQVSSVPGTVEDWLREQDVKRERGELEKPWERKIVREWDVGKNGKEKEKDKFIRDDHLMEKRRHRTPERSPEPARKFKRKEEEAPAKLLDDLFRKTKSVPCIYWLPLSAETIAIKEEQRRKHMAEHERRMLELRRTQRRH